MNDHVPAVSGDELSLLGGAPDLLPPSLRPLLLLAGQQLGLLAARGEEALVDGGLVADDGRPGVLERGGERVILYKFNYLDTNYRILLIYIYAELGTCSNFQFF